MTRGNFFILVMAALAVCYWAGDSVGYTFRSIFEDRDEHYSDRNEAPNAAEYSREIQKALVARKRGDLDKALAFFGAAATQPFAESPNYELWPDMAELYCATNRKREGAALLKEYSCAVDIMAGRRQCWLNAETSLRIPNPSVSPLCYSTVCSAEYEGYYGQSRTSQTLRARDTKDRAAVGKLQKMCAD